MENIKLYIRLNEQNEIIHAFTTIFEQPKENDIIYLDSSSGHVGESAPELTKLMDFEQMEYRLKFIDGKIVEKTPDELFSLSKYQDKVLKTVSQRSWSERTAILDDQTIINVLSGATTDYPPYLTSANVASMIEQFKTIAKAAKASIKSATTKAEIDAILSNLRFPTEAEILAAINK